MAPLDRALTLREQQLQEALDLLIDRHGAQSETVALIRGRLEDVQEKLVESQVDHSHQEAYSGNIMTTMGAPSVKDSAVMWVILGGVLIFAFGGMSTMFVLMMAAKW